MDLAMDEDVNVALGKTMIPTYLCPSSEPRLRTAKKPRTPCRLADPSMQFAVIDYNGLNGAESAFHGRPQLGQLQDHGGFAERQQLRIANFVDGTSQTIRCRGNGELRPRRVDSRPAALQPGRLRDQLAERIQQRPEFRLSGWVQPARDEPGTGEGHRQARGGFRAATPAERTRSSSMGPSIS